jgi:Ca2+-binding EF-hand superfamily protein
MTVIINPPEYEGYDVPAIEKKIQTIVFSRRIRIKDMFRDYDPRRSWRCSKAQFIRALDTAGIKITHAEAASVADFYVDHASGDVHYGKFSDSIDQCFGPKYLEGVPEANVPEPGEFLTFGFQANGLSEEHMEILAYVMHRIALLCRTRGLNFKNCFRNYDVTKCGCVTEQQFRRCFPFEGFTEEEMDVLVNRYTDKERSALNGINYQCLHDDVMDRIEAPPDPPFPRSDLVIHPDHSTWTAGDYSPEEKVQARVVERRIRIREWFTDYDPLRKGYTTAGQARSILGLCLVPVAQADWEALCAKYCREDGMFNYAKFCDVVDEAFSVKGLEKTPQTRITMPDVSVTIPGRRNRMKLSAEDEYEVSRVEEDIRARVQQRRIALKPYFEDFDPARHGHVTKNQFSRALGSLGFELTEDEVNILAMKYCDMGNKFEMNYWDFCNTCDPQMDILAANAEDRRVNLKPDNTYFTRTYDSGVVSGPAAVAARCHTVVPMAVGHKVVSEGPRVKDRSFDKVLYTN